MFLPAGRDTGDRGGWAARLLWDPGKAKAVSEDRKMEDTSGLSLWLFAYYLPEIYNFEQSSNSITFFIHLINHN